MIYSKFKSHAVGFEAYNLKWYNYSTKFQKLVSNVIFRSQDNSITVTVGKFYPVDLAIFADTLEKSIGYFTLIKSIYGDN